MKQGSDKRFKALNDKLMKMGQAPCQRCYVNEIRGELRERSVSVSLDLLALKRALGDGAAGSNGNSHHLAAAIALWVQDGVWYQDAYTRLRELTDREKIQNTARFFEEVGWQRAED